MTQNVLISLYFSIEVHFFCLYWETKGHGPPSNQSCEALQLNIITLSVIFQLYIFSQIHPFTIASAGFESATFWIQVTYARHSAKLSNVPLSINDFILHYVDNFVTKRTLPQRIEFDWIDHQFTYTVHCMKSRAQLSWNSTFRWAPTSRTGGVLLRAKIIFWNETSFQKWFLLTDLFYFYMYLLFSSLSFPPFPLFIFVIVFFLGLFSYLIILINFYFQHTYFFFRI